MITEFVEFIAAWYNLPFTTLLLLGILLAMLQLVGLGGDHEGDADHDMDLDHDVSFDHDVSIDHDVSFDHDVSIEHDISIDHDVALDHEVDLDHDLGVEHDADLDHDLDVSHHVDAGDHEVHAGHGDSSTLTLLAFLGIGKAPLMVVLLLLLFFVGLAGWIFNGIAFNMLGGYPGMVFAIVFPSALLAGALISSRITRFIGRALPPISTTAMRAAALVGMRGTVISPFVDERYGQVHIRNTDGTLITVFAVNDGVETIKRGDHVVLVTYKPEQRIYIVTRALPE